MGVLLVLIVDQERKTTIRGSFCIQDTVVLKCFFVFLLWGSRDGGGDQLCHLRLVGKRGGRVARGAERSVTTAADE